MFLWFFRDLPTCKPFLLTFATLCFVFFDFFVTKVDFRAYIYMPFNCSISELNQPLVSKITGVRPNQLFCMSVFSVKCPIKGFVREGKKL